jgi:hypothetical protein
VATAAMATPLPPSSPPQPIKIRPMKPPFQTWRVTSNSPETKVFLLLFLQKKKILVLFLKKKNQKHF